MNYLELNPYISINSLNFPVFVFSLIFFLLIIGLATTVFYGFPLYQMYKLAKLKNPWMAFIPFFNSFKIYNLANFSMWYIIPLILISFIPIMGVLIVYIFAIYLNYKVIKSFNVSTSIFILGILIPIVAYWYISIVKPTFIRKLNSKFCEESGC